MTRSIFLQLHHEQSSKFTAITDLLLCCVLTPFAAHPGALVRRGLGELTPTTHLWTLSLTMTRSIFLQLHHEQSSKFTAITAFALLLCCALMPFAAQPKALVRGGGWGSPPTPRDVRGQKRGQKREGDNTVK